MTSEGGHFTDWMVSRGLSGEMFLSGVLKEPLDTQAGPEISIANSQRFGCDWCNPLLSSAEDLQTCVIEGDDVERRRACSGSDVFMCSGPMGDVSEGAQKAGWR